MFGCILYNRTRLLASTMLKYTPSLGEVVSQHSGDQCSKKMLHLSLSMVESCLVPLPFFALTILSVTSILKLTVN